MTTIASQHNIYDRESTSNLENFSQHGHHGHKENRVTWDQLLAQIPKQQLRHLATEVWIQRKTTRHSYLKSWMTQVSRQWRGIAGFRPGNYDSAPSSTMCAPLAQTALSSPEAAAHFVALWIDVSYKLVSQLMAWVADAGTPYIEVRNIDPARIATGFASFPDSAPIARVIAQHSADITEKWRLKIAGLWVHTYFEQVGGQPVDATPINGIENGIELQSTLTVTAVPSFEETPSPTVETETVPTRPPDVLAEIPALATSLSQAIVSVDGCQTQLNASLQREDYGAAQRHAEHLVSVLSEITSNLALLSHHNAQIEALVRTRFEEQLSVRAAELILRLLPEEPILRSQHLSALWNELASTPLDTAPPAVIPSAPPEQIDAQSDSPTADEMAEDFAISALLSEANYDSMIGAEVSDVTSNDISPALLNEPVSLNANGRIAPEKRGGRPRGYSAESSQAARQSTRGTTTFAVVAQQEGNRWKMFVEAAGSDDETLDRVVAVQDGYSLQRDAQNTSRWRLSSLNDIQITLEDGTTHTVKMRWHAERILAFRLSKRDIGRQVTSLSIGTYLFLAPEHWLPHMKSYRAEEKCAISGFRAHFVHLTQSASVIEFVGADGVKHPISNRAGFTCEGPCVADAESERPSIYLNEPPRLVAPTARDWAQISCVVVVEEGPNVAKHRRFAFSPTPERLAQELTVLQDIAGGWFTARLYDLNDDLVDTLSFRFARGLSGLAVEHTGLVPLDGQQPTATVCASYTPPLKVLPAQSLLVMTQFSEDGFTTLLPSHPSTDLTEWQIVLNDESVLPLTLRARRLWWAIAESEPALEAWSASSIPCLRKLFRASSRARLWIKAPPDAQIHFGFSKDTAHSLAIDAITGIAELRLGSLADHPALTDVGDEVRLLVWLEETEVVVARIPSDFPRLVSDVVQESDVDAPTLSYAPVSSSKTLAESLAAERYVAPLRIVEERPVDYTHLAEIADDPAFHWYAIQCMPGSEERLVKLLQAQLAAQHLSESVPIVVFPQTIQKVYERQRFVERKMPALTAGYLFVLMRPEISLQRLLMENHLQLLVEEISAEWLDTILRYKCRQPEAGKLGTISVGQTVLITEGVLKGQTGKVLECYATRQSAVVAVTMAARVLHTEIPFDQLVVS